MTQLGEELAEGTCVPCGRGVERLSRDEVDVLMGALPAWTLGEDGRALERGYAFDDFAHAFNFVATIAAIAEAQGHHPDLGLGWGYVTVHLQTHAIDGLHRNDFIVAARIERAFTSTAETKP